MELNLDGEIPIFLQFAEMLEDNILKGVFEEETQIPSTTEVAVKFKINPATANRGVNLLVEEGIIYKKRGIGMFVCTGAKEKITARRKEAFFENYIIKLVDEAKSLNISMDEIMSMIGRSYNHEHN